VEGRHFKAAFDEMTVEGEGGRYPARLKSRLPPNGRYDAGRLFSLPMTSPPPCVGGSRRGWRPVQGNTIFFIAGR